MTGPDGAPREGARLLDAVALMDTLCTDGAWESQQTHSSLTGYLVEETYELLDAIASGDRDEVVAELGDVLLQVLFHARIGADFTIDDVAESFIRKVSARSAGVLAGGVDLATQVDDWERAKSRERPDSSAMDGIPAAQPALALAAKILARARDAGVPADAFPAGLTTVTVGPDGGAEERLRAEALEFARRIRAAERAMRAARPGDAGTDLEGGERRARPSADEWRTALS
ncbi:MazG nucleotide pyrophosphohydrolase domain-containing protein [Tomitella cavernea]|uniref:NTP pyrophosphohydrolase MazG-like domain-containing protein n=1 Tax=Tomitella cavernea TaxID=1387982 RepID=A0ABP9CIS1_9ACTN|nr:MazG nucleotide pyrophosphohydrolase domain-containing protein [Tomitella cavernea]